MASIYRTLLREIERDNFQVLHQRVSLTPLRKFWLAWKVQALGRRWPLRLMFVPAFPCRQTLKCRPWKWVKPVLMVRLCRLSAIKRLLAPAWVKTLRRLPWIPRTPPCVLSTARLDNKATRRPRSPYLLFCWWRCTSRRWCLLPWSNCAPQRPLQAPWLRLHRRTPFCTAVSEFDRPDDIALTASQAGWAHKSCSPAPVSLKLCCRIGPT
jgi:hypothetical protein